MYWIGTDPFDRGFTITSALNGEVNVKSQANGALMRISPLGIFCGGLSEPKVMDWAMQDAKLTHPNIVCQQVNALYAKAIAAAVEHNLGPQEIYEMIYKLSIENMMDPSIITVIEKARTESVADHTHLQGWVLIAFQNTLWQLLHAETLEEAIIDTVMRGSDTDTNAAICGALLGAVHGISSIPDQWKNSVLSCKPSHDNANPHQPRPEVFWPTDALELATALVGR